MTNNTFSENRIKIPYAEYAVLAVIMFLHYSDFISIKIAGASPLIFIPLCVSVSMFYGTVQSIIFFGVAGVLADCFAGNTHIFNLSVMLITGIVLAVTVKYLFNNNIAAALTLTGIASGFYFSAKWIVFYLLPNVSSKMFALSRIFLPSFLYTVAFIFPIYLLKRKANK